MLDFAKLFAFSRDIGFITDLRGAVLAVTAGAEKALGYPASELVGIDLPHLDEAGDLRRFFDQDGDAESRMHVGFHLRAKSGRVLTIDALASSLREESGKPIGWFLSGQDLRGAVAEARGTRPIVDALLDSIGAAIWSFDRNGTVLTWGRACEEIFGVPRLEAEGKLPVIRLFPSPEEFRRILAAVDRQGVYSGETSLISKGRVLRPSQLVVTPLASGGLDVGYTAISFDLSERKRLEEFQRVLFERVGEAILVVDPLTKRVIDANDRASELLGYSREELLTIDVSDLRPPGEAQASVEKIRRSLEETDRYESQAELHRRKDGTVIPCELNVRRILVGGRRYSIALLRDATERLKADEFFRVLFEKSADAVYLVEGEGLRVVEANEAACAMLGYTRAEMLTLRVPDLVPPDKRHLIPSVRESVSSPAGFRRDRRLLLRKDGSSVPTDHTISQIVIRGKPYFIASSRDLTDSEKAARELEEAKAFLEAVQEGASDGISILDESGVYLSVNQKLMEMHGRPKDYFVGQHYRDRTKPENVPAYDAYWKRLLSGERVRMKAMIPHVSGRMTPVDVSSAAFVLGSKRFIVAIIRDVTDQERVAEELERRVRERTSELKQSEERFRGAFAHGGIGMALVSTEGKWLQVNRALADMVGYSEAELLDRTFNDITHEDDRERSRDLAAQMLAGKLSHSRLEKRYLHKDGRVIWADIFTTLLRDDAGKALYFVTGIQDVTERKRSEEALRASEDRYRLVATASNTGIWDWSPATGKIYFSPIWKRQIGYQDGELENRLEEWRDRLHPEDREGSLRRLEERMAAGRSLEFEEEFRLRHRDGSYRRILALGIVIVDEAGKPARLVGTHVDVTERREAEENLRESEEKFRQLAERIRQVFYVAEADLSRIHYISPAYEEMWGRSCKSLYREPRSWMEGIHPEDRERVLKAFDPGESHDAEYRVVRPDGSVRWVRDRSFEIQGPDGKTVRMVGFVEDFTERRKAEDELRMAHDQLERRVEERTTLLSEEIAERRRAEERLRLYREVFSFATEGIIILRPDGTLLEQNDAHRKLLGYTDEEIREGALALQSTDWFPRVMKEIREKGRYRGEVVIRAKSKAALQVELTAFPVMGAGTEPLCLVAIKRDITERKRGEEALRDSEERWRSVVTHAPDTIITADREGRILSINRTVPGYTVEGTVGRKLYEFVPPEQAHVMAAAVEQVLQTGEPTGYEIQAAGVSGHIAWYSSRVGPILRGSKVIGVTIVATDVTARREAEETLRFQKTLLESQSEAAIDGILVVSTDGRMISYNRRFVEMWEIPQRALDSRSDELAIQSVLEKLVDSEAFLSRVRHLYQHPDEESRDEILLKDGRTFDRYSAPIRSLEGAQYGRVWYFRDVTGRKRTEQELRRAAEETRKAYEDLKQAQEGLIRSEKLASIGMLVSGVAHEINNPLNVMYGNLQLLAERLVGPAAALKKAPARKIKSMLRDALRAAEHARNIVEEFRSFARDTKTAELVDLNVCLEEMAALARRELGPRIRMVRRLGRIPPLRCFRGQMNQVFLNLLKNAGEAIERRGTVTVRTAKKDGQVVVEVADTGRGIPDDVRGKLFEPFFTTKPVGKGLGLGLSISAMIVQNHGGRISVRSRPGKGSVFRVELPLKS